MRSIFCQRNITYCNIYLFAWALFLPVDVGTMVCEGKSWGSIKPRNSGVRPDQPRIQVYGRFTQLALGCIVFGPDGGSVDQVGVDLLRAVRVIEDGIFEHRAVSG